MGLVLAGIMFHDITTLLLDPEAFKDTIDLFVERYKDKDISVVAGKSLSCASNVLLLLPPLALGSFFPVNPNLQCIQHS